MAALSHPEDPAPKLRDRVDSFPKGTVTELVDWCTQRGLNPDEVQLTGTHLRFASWETPEEVERRLHFWREQQRRHREYERRQWATLRETYGEAGPPPLDA